MAFGLIFFYLLFIIIIIIIIFFFIIFFLSPPKKIPPISFLTLPNCFSRRQCCKVLMKTKSINVSMSLFAESLRDDEGWGAGADAL